MYLKTSDPERLELGFGASTSADFTKRKPNKTKLALAFYTIVMKICNFIAP